MKLYYWNISIFVKGDRNSAERVQDAFQFEDFFQKRVTLA